jgi:hypothetical protein
MENEICLLGSQEVLNQEATGQTKKHPVEERSKFQDYINYGMTLIKNGLEENHCEDDIIKLAWVDKNKTSNSLEFKLSNFEEAKKSHRLSPVISVFSNGKALGKFGFEWSIPINKRNVDNEINKYDFSIFIKGKQSAFSRMSLPI